MSMTRYIWDNVNDNVLMEKDENGTTTAVYTHEPGRHGKLISQRRGENTSFYHYDGLGSATELTNESEEVTDTYRYKAYGEPVSTTGSTVNPFRWVGSRGYYWDEELGQYYVRARHYEPSVARWLSRDPIGYYGGDVNLYAYVSSHPLNLTDPAGLRRPPITPPPVVEPVLPPSPPGVSAPSVAVRGCLRAVGAAAGSITIVLCDPTELGREAEIDTRRQDPKCDCRKVHPEWPACPPQPHKIPAVGGW